MDRTGRRDTVTLPLLRLAGGWAVLLLLVGCGGPTADETPIPSVGLQTGEVGSTARGSNESPTAPPSVPLPAARPAQTAPQDAATASSLTADTDKDQHEHWVREQAQWQAWFATARESPDVSVRLQALEQWAQRPGDPLDPVTYGLVDEDEQVRERAQALYEQQLAQEAVQAAQTEPTQVSITKE